ncbi:UNVERIFIED_CONTAM: hypothetical protein GTU68_011706 [Idotea baltica]|nr:hypothetical protein [Idotea baltica]
MYYFLYFLWFSFQVTYVDFFIYEVLDVNCALSSTCLDSFENLKNFKSNIESLPAIKKFMESSRFIKNEINAPMALFGGK